MLHITMVVLYEHNQPLSLPLTGQDPLKITKYKIQCRAFIGPPAKPHLIALLIMVFEYSLSRGTKVEKMLTLAPERYTAGICMVAKVILWCI